MYHLGAVSRWLGPRNERILLWWRPPSTHLKGGNLDQDLESCEKRAHFRQFVQPQTSHTRHARIQTTSDDSRRYRDSSRWCPDGSRRLRTAFRSGCPLCPSRAGHPVELGPHSSGCSSFTFAGPSTSSSTLPVGPSASTDPPPTPIQSPADLEILSESKVLEKAWDLVLYGGEFVVASESDQPRKLATIGRPAVFHDGEAPRVIADEVGVGFFASTTSLPTLSLSPLPRHLLLVQCVFPFFRIPEEVEIKCALVIVNSPSLSLHCVGTGYVDGYVVKTVKNSFFGEG